MTARRIIAHIPRTHSNLDSYLSGRNITRPDDAVSASIGISRACPNRSWIERSSYAQAMEKPRIDGTATGQIGGLSHFTLITPHRIPMKSTG